MSKWSYRVLCFVVVHVVIFAVASSGVLNSLTVLKSFLLAPVWFFGTLGLILGSERLLGVGAGDQVNDHNEC